LLHILPFDSGTGSAAPGMMCRSALMMSVVHARDPLAGKELMEQARRIFNTTDLFLTDLSVSVAANLGPGTVGIVAFPAE
jgi:fatty acid-binding protein DegV